MDGGGTLRYRRKGAEIGYGKGWVETSKTSVAEFGKVLARSLEANVVDETHIEGLFDFKLRWTPDLAAAAPAADPIRPSIFTALRERCGLRVEPPFCGLCGEKTAEPAWRANANFTY